VEPDVINSFIISPVNAELILKMGLANLDVPVINETISG
jgi:hypothetical protein